MQIAVPIIYFELTLLVQKSLFLFHLHPHRILHVQDSSAQHNTPNHPDKNFAFIINLINFMINLINFI